MVIYEVKAKNQTLTKAEKRELLVVFDDLKAVLDDRPIIAEAMDILIADSEIIAFTLTFGILQITSHIRLISA
ncbi:uncharacterized protein EAE98_010037 [Botrytis deweyae]|uniref:Uncharacterized protein n=1 Tax=Botrytis deweyae TaxID=2478750 RepID=A0ABQ7I9V9_9HELO|nr:uncharacterized protein EAE98_010037 [Botrytis deweyae]KAF7917621.1 hypothetical protein EAE98_010037 [Botrytis deweyae]